MPQVFDSLAVRLDGPRAWDHHLTICWEFTDDGAMYVTELRNGALNHRTAGTPPAAWTSRQPWATGRSRWPAARPTWGGSCRCWRRSTPDFAIVTP